MITIQCTACWCSWNKLALLLNLIQLKERFNIKSPVFLFLLEMNTTWQKLKDARGIFLPLLRRKTVIKLQLFCFFLLWTTDIVCVFVCVRHSALSPAGSSHADGRLMGTILCPHWVNLWIRSGSPSSTVHPNNFTLPPAQIHTHTHTLLMSAAFGKIHL